MRKSEFKASFRVCVPLLNAAAAFRTEEGITIYSIERRHTSCIGSNFDLVFSKAHYTIACSGDSFGAWILAHQLVRLTNQSDIRAESEQT